MFPLRQFAGLLCFLTLFACTTPEQQSRDATSEGGAPPLEVAAQSEPTKPSPTEPGPEPEMKQRAKVAGESDALKDLRAMQEPRRMLGKSETMAQGAPGTFAPASPAIMEDGFSRYSHLPQNTEKYAHLDDNPIKLTTEHPVSTFSIDVDTGSYANVRRFLSDGQLPPADAVRVEEMINYFPYTYAGPGPQDGPFAVHTEIAPSPWNKDTHLLRVAIKGKDVAKESLPPANLVFLIDVSGSMDEPNKLPLLKSAFRLFTKELRPQDKVSMVVYAGASGVVLPPTSGRDKEKILFALNRLSAGGSTHGAAGIELAYRVAHDEFISGGINRVLLATDGDFNVGVTNFEALKSLIENKRKTGISLSTLGFGTGNYNDQLMKQLADVGNGNYSYIDTINEGRKTLVEEFTSTLAIIAKDVKIQMEFNPGVVAEYRLIGYESRLLKREDFNNDKIDAGEIGAGHCVTALYEIRLHGHGKSLIDPLRYQTVPSTGARSDEIALLRLRHKEPEGEASKLREVTIATRDIKSAMAATSAEFRFAAAVAAFGQELKGGKYLGSYSYDELRRLAKDAISEDRFGYRTEFLDLVDTAKGLSGHAHARLNTADD